MVARDRDRLRQEILERLGWNIHRVWSTDWIRNRRDSIHRILVQVDRLRRKGDESAHFNEPPKGSPPPTPRGNGNHEEDEAGSLLALEAESDPYAAIVV